ncbi:MAG: hypothetical protein L6R41_005622 [Letrouitia leprolyta]|nr:MAG: hypothetical protein L6R41_005622 [Letrouitia leprolyta]
MGNLCSKSSNKPSSSSDPFSHPGRTLSSAPPPPQSRAQIPKSTTQGRTLGGGGAVGGESAAEDARRAAARAAEERAAAAKSGGQKGKLARELAAQRGQSRVDTLEGVSREERRRREVEEGRGAREWN